MYLYIFLFIFSKFYNPENGHHYLFNLHQQTKWHSNPRYSSWGVLATTHHTCRNSWDDDYHDRRHSNDSLRWRLVKNFKEDDPWCQHDAGWNQWVEAWNRWPWRTYESQGGEEDLSPSCPFRKPKTNPRTSRSCQETQEEAWRFASR